MSKLISELLNTNSASAGNPESVMVGELVFLSSNHPTLVEKNGAIFLREGNVTTDTTAYDPSLPLIPALVFTKKDTFPNVTIFSVWKNGSVVIAVGDSGRIYRSEDHGETWTQRPSGITNGLRAVCSDGISTWIAVGESSRVLRSTDNGLTWALVTAGISGTVVGCCFGAGRWVICTDSSSTGRASTDGGITWSNVTLLNNITPRNPIAFLSGRWFIGANGGLRYSDDGVTWIVASFPMGTYDYFMNIVEYDGILGASGFVYNPDTYTYYYTRWVSTDRGVSWTRDGNSHATFDRLSQCLASTGKNVVTVKGSQWFIDDFVNSRPPLTSGSQNSYEIYCSPDGYSYVFGSLYSAGMFVSPLAAGEPRPTSGTFPPRWMRIK